MTETAREKFALLPGEEITFDESKPKHESSDEKLNQRYAKGDVRIVTETARYSLAGILTMLQETMGNGEPRYKLDPEYQRRHRWNVVRRSRLIESFLMNVPVPPVFLYEKDLARFEVMDGRQRLATLRDFYDDKFELQGLQHWPELDGRTYSRLPSKVRDGIDRRYISSIILLKETAADEEQAAKLTKMVFERLNSGGVKLSSQENRNAVYDGQLNQLCMKLSENAEFKSMWGFPVDLPPEEDEEEMEGRDEGTKTGQGMFKKMEDVELVLRFFAYRQIELSPGGLNRIADFLDRFLNEGNKFDQNIIAEYETLFNSTISFIYQSFGEKAFYGVSSRPTKVVYDALMFISSQYAQGEFRVRLLAGKDVLNKEVTKMYDEYGEVFGGRRTNNADMNKRNALVAEVFQKTLADLGG